MVANAKERVGHGAPHSIEIVPTTLIAKVADHREPARFGCSERSEAGPHDGGVSRFTYFGLKTSVGALGRACCCNIFAAAEL
jgi:hypothetical protein